MSVLSKLLIVTLIVSRIIYTFHAIIPDCDETFNYYDPLNFLVRGFGKQTWEYSPEYSIRSYAYLMPFVTVLKVVNALIPGLTYQNFYIVRGLLGILNVVGIVQLFKSIQRYNKEISIFFLIFSIINTGESHAAVNFVPSAVCLSLINLSLASFFNYLGTCQLRDALNSTLFLALAGLLGWPFVLAFGLIPMLAISYHNISSFKRLSCYITGSAFYIGTILAIIAGIDYVFYKKLEIVPLNIVLYNVINTSEDSGPNIFGVEPFSYYLKNIILNFNLIGVAAYASVLTLPFSHLIFEHEPSLNWVTIVQLGLWSTIFGIQPHKEERFLYPIYSLINLSGALFFSKVFKLVYLLTKSKTIQRTVRFLTISIIVVLSLLKSINLSHNYSAPLQIYKQIPTDIQGNICLGREWHRFPSSFFLGDNQRLKFIKSGFDGLLPGDFDEDLPLTEATSSIPKHMNNLNKFESGKIITDFVSNCEFVIDINELFSEDDEFNVKDLLYHFKLLSSVDFLNNEKSTGIAKIFWLPEKLRELTKSKLVYHEYKLYQNRHRERV